MGLQCFSRFGHQHVVFVKARTLTIMITLVCFEGRYQDKSPSVHLALCRAHFRTPFYLLKRVYFFASSIRFMLASTFRSFIFLASRTLLSFGTLYFRFVRAFWTRYSFGHRLSMRMLERTSSCPYCSAVAFCWLQLLAPLFSTWLPSCAPRTFPFRSFVII
jgi:hypothetical protein